MNKNILIISVFVLNSFITVGQTKREIKSEIEKLRKEKFAVQQFNSFSKADSLFNILIESNTDTILLFHQFNSSIKKNNADGTSDYKVSTIIWKKNDSLFIQKINNYAIYKPINTWRGRTDLHYLFRYYLKHEEILHHEEIQATRRRGYISLANDLEKLTESNQQISIIKFNVGGRTSSWNFPGIGMGAYLDNNKFLEDLDKRLYMLTMLLERVNDENISGRQWVPINLKYLPDHEYQKKLDAYEDKLLQERKIEKKTESH